MSTTSAKSSSGRTFWQLIDGRLKETGSDSYTFTLTAEDTLTLFKLLLIGKDEILRAVQKERHMSQQEVITVNTQQDTMLTDSGPQMGSTSSIEIDQQLRGAGQTIHKTRGV